MYRSIVAVLSMLLVACGGTAQKSTDKTAPERPAEKVVVEMEAIVPVFDADSAYSFVEKQVAFGPRVPGSVAHKKCGDYLASVLRGYGANVIEQTWEATAYNGDKLPARNIIAEFAPEKSDRILLCAHWDSRPWADEDPDKRNHRTPILGANDGASGVGVLMEIARQISQAPTALGVDIILFDAEDYGLHNSDEWSEALPSTYTWALGSQYWGQMPHKFAYRARYGILLDIVGAPDAKFHREMFSMEIAPDVVDKVWSRAKKLGHGDVFINGDGGAITDDHLFVHAYAGVRCIDIIAYDAESDNGFGKYWHTVKDDMNWIDASTLRAVGETVMAVIYNEK